MCFEDIWKKKVTKGMAVLDGVALLEELCGGGL